MSPVLLSSLPTVGISVLLTRQDTTNSIILSLLFSVRLKLKHLQLKINDPGREIRNNSDQEALHHRLNPAEVVVVVVTRRSRRQD